jgi:uroporphyrinogen-III decarboxylase
VAGQLISYIAPGAPATRQPATGDQPFLRPEIGFTPKWYHDALGIDFGERWHTDVSYRHGSLAAMRAELDRRFPGTKIGAPGYSPDVLDLLTGVHGACVIAGIYELPIVYRADQWPVATGTPLSDEQLARVQPPGLDNSPFFDALMRQVERIEERVGRVAGYVNWQGVLNNAHRLRGEELFTDMFTAPELCHRLFDCVCSTMIDAARRLHRRQRATGFEVAFFTVSNCLVNLVSPELYREFLYPCDRRLADAFGALGVHNCAWNVDPYLDTYASLPNVAYIDMGLESDFTRARALLPDARRAVMYRPTELADKPLTEIERDLDRICRELGPCDLVAADIESGTPDERVAALVNLCRRMSETYKQT